MEAILKIINTLSIDLFDLHTFFCKLGTVLRSDLLHGDRGLIDKLLDMLMQFNELFFLLLWDAEAH